MQRLQKSALIEIVSSPQISVTQIEEGKPFIFTAEVALKPAVTLGDYKGVEVEKSVHRSFRRGSRERSR